MDDEKVKYYFLDKLQEKKVTGAFVEVPPYHVTNLVFQLKRDNIEDYLLSNYNNRCFFLEKGELIIASDCETDICMSAWLQGVNHIFGYPCALMWAVKLGKQNEINWKK